MPAHNEPLDPNKNPSSDTSERLEINEQEQAEGAATASAADSAPAEEDQIQQEAQEDWATMLAEAQEQVASYHEQLLRAKAEVENIRRRAQEEVAKARKFGTESFAESLVPVKDSLEAALAQPDQSLQSWQDGVQITLKQLNAAFERNLLKEIAPSQGDKFDPHVHQAISSLPSAQPEGTIIDVLQKGYTIADRVLRPALVTVSAGGQ